MACDICGRVRTLGGDPDLLLDAPLRQFARQACGSCCAELERRMMATGQQAGVVIREMRAGQRRERPYLDRI
jgi:hypothetical protein